MKESQLEQEKKKTVKSKSDSENKAKIMEDLKKEIAKYEKQKKQDEEIHSLIQKGEIRDIFENHKKTLKRVYEWYCLSTHHAFGELNQSDTLLFKPFMALGREFAIYPTIISIREVELIFKSLTKVKPTIPGMQPSLTFEDFEEALVRIAIKGRNIFEQIYTAKVGKGLKNSEPNKSLNETDKNLEEEQEDNYDKISATTVNTIQGLLFYLDLPSDKQALFSKLNGLRNQSTHPKEKKQSNYKKVLTFHNSNYFSGRMEKDARAIDSE